MMVFHNCSAYIKEWMTKQPCVKEESLTDWMLFDISNKLPQIYYQAFTRYEESSNGCDWEWWILTPDQFNIRRTNAYRFLVQAKKLLPVTKDNYPLFNYSNRNGLQIELLLKSAQYKKAFPLYMFYSNEHPDIETQIELLDFIDEAILRWCATCDNGGYLASASMIYEMILGNKRMKYSAIDILNYSCKLSLCDKLFSQCGTETDEILSHFNKQLIKRYGTKGKYNDTRMKNRGIKYDIDTIPRYVHSFMENKDKDISWFESEMHRQLGDIGGLGIIDLRNE